LWQRHAAASDVEHDGGRGAQLTPLY
jgi:hypothetical protein